MFDEFLSKATELRSRGESFAVATVVRYEGTISGKPGDKAIIYPNGELWGWIGGGCAQPAVVKESLQALQDGAPRLIRVSPSTPVDPVPGIVHHPMTCHSGGTLDIYIEPVLAKPQIVILGRSLVAQTLARLGKAIDFSVSVIAPGATCENFPDADVIREQLELSDRELAPRSYIVVSTQGESDEEALEIALATRARYIAFVASKNKAEKVFEYLRAKGIPSGELSRIHAPAGVPIGAVSPEEIAVSVLAEIVQAGRSKPEVAAAPPAQRTEATDPVCGMTVDTDRAKHRSEYEGESFYFCCARCKQTFDLNPAQYPVRTEA
jgi:xanthine dehydrogenase accessory factor